jgi:hypothetical protein
MLKRPETTMTIFEKEKEWKRIGRGLSVSYYFLRLRNTRNRTASNAATTATIKM